MSLRENEYNQPGSILPLSDWPVHSVVAWSWLKVARCVYALLWTAVVAPVVIKMQCMQHLELLQCCHLGNVWQILGGTAIHLKCGTDMFINTKYHKCCHLGNVCVPNLGWDRYSLEMWHWHVHQHKVSSYYWPKIHWRWALFLCY